MRHNKVIPLVEWNAAHKYRERPPFPKVLDNTQTSTFRSCETKFWWNYCRSLSRFEESIHLISGGAFAKGLEVTRRKFFEENLSFDDALCWGAAALLAEYGPIEPNPKHILKNAWNMVGALEFYFTQWPIDQIMLPERFDDGKWGIEFSFALPIPGVTHPETGEPILYAGRFDMIGIHHLLKMRLGEDDKTTTQLGQQWRDQWRLSNQISGYCWGAQQHGIPLRGFNIRGTALRIRESYESEDLPVLRGAREINHFEKNLTTTVKRMINSWNRNYFERVDSYECAKFGGCDYMRLCEAEDPEQWIDGYYVPNTWNPLASRT